jgi:hypothetical protein
MAVLSLLSLILFKAVPGLLVAYGGVQMLQRRSYAWAMAAAIISIVSCSLLGFPVGIWALVVLTRADVRQAFGVAAPGAPATAPGDRFWRRFAVVAGIVLILILLAILAAGVLFIGVRS